LFSCAVQQKLYFFDAFVGTDDKHLLPTYYYRDDALDIWKVLEDYVTRLIRFFYKSDEVSWA